MKCPKCESPMHRMSSEDVFFDFCNACSAVWLEGDAGRESGVETFTANPEFIARLSDIADLLSERQAEFHAFLDHAPLELGIKDLEGRYVMINQYTADLYGLGTGDVRGKLPNEAFPAADAAMLAAETRKVLDTGAPNTVEVDDGEGRFFLATYFPIRDQRGQITSIGSIAIDATKRREAEMQLAKLNEELESLVERRTRALEEAQDELLKQTKLAMVGQLTATVSHELRNPMATMRTSVFLINELIEHDNERVERALARLERSLQRCDSIIDELLDFARTKEAVLEPLNVDRWLAGLLDEYEPAESIELQTHLDARDANVAADQERLRRAVVNIIDNACHALLKQRPTDDPHPDPRVTASSKLMEDRVIIKVADNGIGMDDEVLQNCFEPLFSTKGFGTGLGLPAAKQILDQHDGGIEISSKPGTGTTVTLWLPHLAQV